jgi:hypothetical protein
MNPIENVEWAINLMALNELVPSILVPGGFALLKIVIAERRKAFKES